jgi:hypothetical protein
VAALVQPRQGRRRGALDGVREIRLPLAGVGESAHGDAEGTSGHRPIFGGPANVFTVFIPPDSAANANER